MYKLTHHESVSNFIRLKLLPNFVVKLYSSWKKLANNIVLVVTINFPDGTSAQMYLHNPWSSYEAFKLKKDSVKDINNVLIPRDGFRSDSSGDMSYGYEYSAGNYFHLYQKCRDYSIKSSDGSWWQGTACFYRTYP